MKAIIILDDVPNWQTGEEVQVFFPDSMCKRGKCIAVLDDDLGQLYSSSETNAKIIYRYLLDDYLKGRFDREKDNSSM